MSIGLDNSGFSDALVILGAAGLVIPAFARFRISPVIGFILVGMLVGPAGLGRLVPDHRWLYYFTITDPAAIEPFAELGIIMLLFSIGLELSFKRLWGMRRLVFGVGAAELLVAAAILTAALGLAGGVGWTGALGLGLALALSSTALVLPLAGTESPVGRAAFAMLLFEDLALVPIIFVLAALGPTADGGLGGFAVIAGIGAATMVALYVGGRFVLPRLFAQAARTKSPELFLAASLLVVIAASLATTAAGLSPIVGALLAGLLIAETDYHAEVEAITAPFKGLALGVFLITVGMSLDLAFVLANLWMLAAAVAAVVAVKAAVTFGLLRLSGSRLGTSVEVGVLMSSPSETTLIVLTTAAQALLIDAQTAAFWQTVTAVGLTITPLLARVGSFASRRVDRHGHKTAAIQFDETGPGTVVIGLGRVGRMVGDMLKVHERRFLAVDADVDAVAAARADGFPAMFGDIARPELIARLELDKADALILTMDDPVLTIRTTRRVRAEWPELTIVARARDTAHAAELYKAGVTDAVPETLESSLQLSEAVLVDLGVAMGPVIASIHEKRDELRKAIRDAAQLQREPRIRRVRRQAEGGGVKRLLALAALAIAMPAAAQTKPRPGIVRVRIETSVGNFTLGLETRRAPATSRNFLNYVDDGRLNGADIYRVARSRKAPQIGFVQGGIRSDATRILPPFPLETTKMTGIKHLDGTISMARRAGPDSAGGNFFITVGPNPSMDWSPAFPGYGAFGHVIENMPLVRRILALPTGARMNGTMLAQPIRIVRAVRLDGKPQPTGRVEAWKIVPKLK